MRFGVYEFTAPIGAGGMGQVWRATETTLEAGTPVRLFHQRVSVDDSIDFAYDLTSDGRFLINTIIDSSLAPITLLMNWNPGNVK